MEQFIANNPLLFLAAVVWTLIWKGLALWKSAHREEKWWFIALLVINTLGLLEILYLLAFSKKNKTAENSMQKDTTSE